MRNFWFFIFYILISSKSFANDEALPALPNIPGSIGVTQDRDEQKPSKDERNSSTFPAAESAPALQDNVGDKGVTSSPGEDNFMDLGSYKLPRVKPADQAPAVAIPAAPVEALPAPAVAIPAAPVEALPAPAVAVPAAPVEALPAPAVAIPAAPVEALPAPAVAIPAAPVEALPAPAVAVPAAPVEALPAPAVAVPAAPVEALPAPAVAVPAAPVEALPAPAVAVPAAPVEALPAPAVAVPAAPVVPAKAPEILKTKQVKKTKHNHSEKIVELTPVQQKFIQDEMVMFLIPDDDIVLGKLTTEAALKEMEGKEYIHLFWKGYEYSDKEMEDYETEIFITTYNHHYVNYARFPLSINEATDVAFNAIVSSNIDNLRTMLDNYPILQSYNKYGDSLLIEAVEMNDLPLAKLLLMRGAYIDPVNNKGESALFISEKYGTDSMYQLMQDAVFTGKIR